MTPRRRSREEILESMHRPEAAMEIRVRAWLDKMGIRYDSHHPFCLESIIPDDYLLDKGISLFLDGPPHEGREDRDEELREKLRRRYPGMKVLAISYKANTNRAFAVIKDQIREAADIWEAPK